MKDFHFQYCKYYKTPFQVGKGSVTGWCTKEEKLKHCKGNPCEYKVM